MLTAQGIAVRNLNKSFLRRLGPGPAGEAHRYIYAFHVSGWDVYHKPLYFPVLNSVQVLTYQVNVPVRYIRGTWLNNRPGLLYKLR